jgi:hypothetical protein
MMARDRELSLPSIVLILHFADVRLVKAFGNRCAKEPRCGATHGRDRAFHALA